MSESKDFIELIFGEWIPVPNMDGQPYKYACSNCHRFNDYRENSCPNCNAFMVGAKTEVQE